jgi:integrase
MADDRAAQTDTIKYALENLALALTSPRRRASGTISSYMSTARIFLNWLGDDRIPPNDKDLRRFFLEREKQGIAGSTLGTQFTQLHKLFTENSWPWPFKKEDKPISDEAPHAPALTPQDVEHLILNRAKYTAQENFYLAISITYGLRRDELAKITSRDIKDNTLLVHISKKKKKETRLHLIPEEIMPIIEAWKPKARGSRGLSYCFQRIMAKSGLGSRKGYGFHSCRRTLLTLLVWNLAENRKDITLAAQFMRWSRLAIGSAFLGSPMAGFYTHPEVLSENPFNLDRTIFQVHPFLHIYRKEQKGWETQQ